MSEMKSLTLNDKTYDSFVDPVARALASASAVIKSASGESITLSDASDVNLYGLNIYGKTTQDGVPTPNAPVELVSVGNNGSITVNVTGKNEAQSMTIATPNGLPGIPVDDGGNYTDENGQQWVCDEKDFAKGVYVQRCEELVIDGSGYVGVGQHSNGQYYCTQEAPGIVMLEGDAPKMVLCDRYMASPWTNKNNMVYCIGRTMVLTDNRFVDKETAISILSVEKPKCMYVLATPIETPLLEEELTAYAALHTYREDTTVSNDAGARMEIEYVMDAKKYIDSLVISGGSAARLSEVTLLASAWNTKNDGLHSQVVTIPGVTEHSKVDLLPSVEQLAIFHNKDVAFVTENEDGVVTVFAIGDKPIIDYTMQVSITEVAV